MNRQKFTEGEPHTMEELVAIVHALRDKEYGCSWDSVQTHESMKKCLTDECAEVLQAVENQDDENLCEELGDVLLQVLLHAEIAQERGAFTLDDIVQGIADKLIRRHPHVFGDEPRPANPEESHALWNKVKKREKQSKYRFYGHENAGSVKAVTEDYPGIETPLDLYGALSELWCRETCAPRMREEWSPKNKTCGQCSITAFLAQDIFGGEVRGTVTENGSIHCFNVVDGIAFDLTSEQFGEKAAKLDYRDCEVQERETPGHFGKEEKRRRYEVLKEKLRRR